MRQPAIRRRRSRGRATHRHQPGGKRRRTPHGIPLSHPGTPRHRRKTMFPAAGGATRPHGKGMTTTQSPASAPPGRQTANIFGAHRAGTAHPLRQRSVPQKNRSEGGARRSGRGKRTARNANGPARPEESFAESKARALDAARKEAPLRETLDATPVETTSGLTSGKAMTPPLQQRQPAVQVERSSRSEPLQRCWKGTDPGSVRGSIAAKRCRTTSFSSSF